MVCNVNILVSSANKTKFNKLEALLRHNKKIFNERRPFNSINCILLTRQLLIQSRAKPRILGMFEYQKYWYNIQRQLLLRGQEK